MPIRTRRFGDAPHCERTGAIFMKREERMERRRRMRFSLRTKGLLSFVALTLFVATLGAYVALERRKLFDAFVAVEHSQREADANRAAKFALQNALMRVNRELFTAGVDPNVLGIVGDVEPATRALERLKPFYPEVDAIRTGIDGHVEKVTQSKSRGDLAELRSSLREAVAVTDRWMTDSVNEHAGTTAEYLQRFSTLTMVTSAGALTGLLLFGLVVSLFFGRLGQDIRRLEARSHEIVGGYRGDPLPIGRSDEVGSLIAAVNRMASELSVRDQQLALAQQQYTHHEKMAAIGALATGVAHEIGNPIAAISGVAQSIMDIKEHGLCPNRGTFCRPDLILQQTERIALITRQIADFATPHSTISDMLDLNALVESTSNFVRYDRRYRGVDIRLELDRKIPAVLGVADHTVQVLMNLMINAADALEAVTDRPRTVSIGTGLENGSVVLSVSDNGSGMTPETLSRAFEAFYTTKGHGKGTGLGLSMCRALIEKMGGSIALTSEPGRGTRVVVTLPVHISGTAQNAARDIENTQRSAASGK